MSSMTRRTPASRTMPLSLTFRFRPGRYHATPFGHHVNEGLIEWPPSPWRILRALLSVGYTTGVWYGAGPPATARRLVEKLSSELPRYYLPPAIGTHCRHYMPIGGLDSARLEKRKLVFDTWAHIEDEELTVSWNDVRLEPSELSVLGVLVERLNYLGRSESWVEGRIAREDEPTPEPNCFPEQHGKMLGLGWEQVPLLAATSASAFSVWRDEQIEQALADLPLPDGKKPSKTLLRKRDQAVQPYPDDLLDCLQKDTTWWRFHGWSQPPGSRRIFYWRPPNAIAVGSPRVRKAIVHAPRVEAVLLSITNASRNDHALPPVTRTLPQADLLHHALVGIAARNGTPKAELTGRDENHTPLRGPHEHAHINPVDLDGDGHLDHILIWAPMGLSMSSQTAVLAARRTFTKGGMEPLRLAMAARGGLEDLANMPGIYGNRIAQLFAGTATSWQSATPFVPPRHMKARGKNTLEGQVRAELHSRGFPEPVSVHQLAPVPWSRTATTTANGAATRGNQVRWNRFRHFILSRQRGPVPPTACGFAIQLDFERPVRGPIALGYGSHFGLGLFEGDT